MGGVPVAVLAAVLSVVPINGGLLGSPQIIINNQVGDQTDPHVAGDLTCYDETINLA